MTTKTYNHASDWHVAAWLSAKFNITVVDAEGLEYMAFEGDYDLDCGSASGDTVFSTALEYAACYDAALFDKLVDIELGA